MTVPANAVLIFTDGACTGNPGPGGWASIVALPNGTVRELGSGDKQTTNNKMEMTAAIRALASLEVSETQPIILYTDSTYVIKGITQWIWGWRSKGWKNSEGGEVANRELWEELLRQTMRLKPSTVEWRYVRGHAGFPGNERCDEIAVAFAKGKFEQLYTGDIDGYFVDLTQLPDGQDIPQQSKGTGSKSSSKGSSSGGASGAVTYLSYYNGVVQRHRTWPDCEKVVKGRNAKFKKAKSSEEEREILRSWGLDPQTAIK